MKKQLVLNEVNYTVFYDDKDVIVKITKKTERSEFEYIEKDSEEFAIVSAKYRRLQSASELTCECCKKNKAVGVYASAMGPVSHAYCKYCLENDIEPYGTMIAFLTCVEECKVEDLSDKLKAKVKKNLEFYNKSIEDFEKELEESIKEMNAYFDSYKGKDHEPGDKIVKISPIKRC